MSSQKGRVITWGAKISAAKKGKPNLNGRSTESDFWNMVDKGTSDQCWLWNGTIRNGGYGNLSFQVQRWDAHRLAWTLARGTIPDGLWVLHKCDVKTCCNPEHLFLGDRQANMTDMKIKGRRKNIGTGESNGRSKLTLAQVLEIKHTYQRGRGNPFNSASLGKKYGVSGAMILFIIRGESWRTACA